MRSPILIEEMSAAVHPRMWLSANVDNQAALKVAVETAHRMLVPCTVKVPSHKALAKIRAKVKVDGRETVEQFLKEAPIYLQYESETEDIGILMSKEFVWSMFRDKHPGAKVHVGGTGFDRITKEFVSITKEFISPEEDKLSLQADMDNFYLIFDCVYIRTISFLPGPSTYRIKDGRKVPYPQYFVCQEDKGHTLLKAAVEKLDAPVPEPEPVNVLTFKLVETDGASGLAATCSVTGKEGFVPFRTNLRAAEIPLKEVCDAFYKAGWDFDPHNPKRVRSPPHAKVTPQPRPVLTLVPKEPAMPKLSEVVLARVLSPKERAAVRDLLDQHFDEAGGFYRDSYSDVKIGDDLGVPFALVSQLREAAYGPIKSDPEIEKLTVKLDDMEGRITAAEATLTQALGELDDLRKAAENIRSSIRNLNQRRKVA